MNVYHRRKDELLMTSDFNKAATASNFVLGKRGILGPGSPLRDYHHFYIPEGLFFQGWKFFIFKRTLEITKTYSEPRMISKVKGQTG